MPGETGVTFLSEAPSGGGPGGLAVDGYELIYGLQTMLAGKQPDLTCWPIHPACHRRDSNHNGDGVSSPRAVDMGHDAVGFAGLGFAVDSAGKDEFAQLSPLSPSLWPLLQDKRG